MRSDGSDSLEHSRLTFDLDVDIAVIGAGLAGLTVALEAARLGASVAVLEGRHVGWNASGHQLGTVMPGYGLSIADLIARIGIEDTRELWALSKQGVEYVRGLATEQLMPGIAPSEGALELSNVDAGDRLIARLQLLGEDFDTEVEGWQVERVRAEIKTDRYFHGVYYPKAFQIDGRKYVHGMPQIGQLRKGLWVASGFGRHGLNTSAMAGQLIARSILSGDERWRLFSPFELVWAGGMSGRVAGFTIGMWERASAATAGALARYRERARAREGIREARLAAANRQAGTRPPPSRQPPGRHHPQGSTAPAPAKSEGGEAS